MSSIFQIKEHVIECQHIREYPRALANSQHDVLHLSVKQYTPLDNLDPQDGDVTIIGAHANGFPKELYEPLWEDLHAQSKKHRFRIRSIWISDVAHQGTSGALNEYLLGNDPSWMDGTRDLLHMINHFRMPTPMIGIGHSLGGAQLVNLSLIHPRLLSTLVLLEPVIQTHASAPTGPSPAQSSAFRRDLWPSKQEAVAAFSKSKFYSAWDPRAFEKWCEYGIRPVPSSTYPDAEKGSMTLTTTKHQECFTFMRPSWEGLSSDGNTILNRSLVPDLNLQQPTRYPLYRPEPPIILGRLPELRPSVFYVFGELSNVSLPVARKQKMDTTGTGLGGSGGAKEGRVKGLVLDGIGHLVAMEAAGKCAEAAAQWIGQEIKIIEKERAGYLEWTKKSLAEKQTLSEEWKARIGGPPVRPAKSKM